MSTFSLDLSILSLSGPRSADVLQKRKIEFRLLQLMRDVCECVVVVTLARFIST